jgi:Domain of unknown function (DUF4160)
MRGRARGPSSQSNCIARSLGKECVWCTNLIVPILSTFFGIVVRVYFEDHSPPHIHVQYAEHHAVVDILTGEILGGSLPPRCAKLVEEWRQARLAELHAAWDAAQNSELPVRIEPLS